MEGESKQETQAVKMDDWKLEGAAAEGGDPNLNICESCQ